MYNTTDYALSSLTTAINDLKYELETAEETIEGLEKKIKELETENAEFQLIIERLAIPEDFE